MKGLAFHEANLYESDLKLIKPPGWLNDNLIAFMMEYFNHVLFPGLSQSACLIHPSAVFVIAHESDQDDMRDTLDNIGIDHSKLLLFPINNSISMLSTGGTHWSLLVYDCGSRACYHFDSIIGSNKAPAKKIVQILSQLSGFPHPLRMHSVHSLQQTNSFDCGIYLLAYCQAICQAFMDYSSQGSTFRLDDTSLFHRITDSVTQEQISEYRDYIWTCIQDIRTSGDI